MNLLNINDQAGQHAPSWYRATSNALPNHPPLTGSINCDVCVIGGGFTGLSCALHLALSGVDTVLLDANRIGWGASGRNGGQVGNGQRVEQTALENNHGVKTAADLWQMARESCDLVRQLIRDHNIDCDYQPGVLDANVTVAQQRDAERYAEHLRKQYQHDTLEVFDRAALRSVLCSDAYAGGVLDTSSGHIHPLNYALGLATAATAAGVRIFEQSMVEKLDYNVAQSQQVPQPDKALSATPHATPYTSTKHHVVSDKGSVTAPRIVLGCNGYLGELEPAIAKRVMPINNYIVATEPLGKMVASTLISNNMAIADSRFIVNYFRMSADHRLLFGGGESWNYRFPKDIRKVVRPRLLSVFPQLENTSLDFAWGGTLAITRTRMPCYREVVQNVFSASGFSGHGVAMATLSGKCIAEAINGDRKRFDLMASLPSPGFPGGSRLRQPLLASAMAWYAFRDRFT